MALSRIVAACLALGIAGVGTESLAQGTTQSLNVQNADIRAFIQDVSKATGNTFVIDPAVQGNVTIAGGAPMDRDDMMEVFLATLRAHGYVAIPTSSGAWPLVMKIKTQAEAQVPSEEAPEKV